MLINQLPTKSDVKLEDNSNVELMLYKAVESFPLDACDDSIPHYACKQRLSSFIMSFQFYITVCEKYRTVLSSSLQKGPFLEIFLVTIFEVT